jgi:hypothetical protein
VWYGMNVGGWNELSWCVGEVDWCCCEVKEGTNI